MEKDDFCNYLSLQLELCSKPPPIKYHDDDNSRFAMCKYFQLIYQNKCTFHNLTVDKLKNERF